MKKTMRRVITLVLAMCMVLAMSMTVFADTVNYTITAPDNTHTYQIYQIFTGDLSDGVLSNIKAGTNYKGSNAAADAKTLADSTATTDADKLAEITKYVDLTGTPAYTVGGEGESRTASVSVPAGYYLIKDVDGSFAGEDDAYTLYLAKIVGDTTISPKTDTPEVVKKVQDTNDSTGETSGWQDSADYDIDDTIPYQITATMGDLSAYKTYYVEFTDTMTHLTYVDGSVKVTVNGTDKTSAFTTSWDADTKTLTVKCADVIAQGAVSNCNIVVTYNATLDSNANIGSTGNPNTVYMEYSNNPNNSGDGTNKPETGKTPEDKNIVFTYKVDANKVTANKDELKGAAFELQKLDAATNTYKTVSIQNATKSEDGKYTIVDADATTFEWKGIDDGTYKIIEVITPAGYNTIADQIFTVEATHDTESDNPQLTALSGNKASGSVITLTADLTAGSLTTDIVNESGSTLPTTGGMGTKIFYLVGAILVLGAGVLLVTRRRMAR